MVVQVPHPTIARDYCLAPARSVEWPARSVDAPSEEMSSKYRRLFPQVAAFTADEEFLIRLGGRQGPCDGGLFAEGGDDASVAAGWPLFGQFVAHDITADRSLLLQHAEVDQLATSAPRGPISSACTGTARSAIPSCTTAVTPASC